MTRIRRRPSRRHRRSCVARCEVVCAAGRASGRVASVGSSATQAVGERRARARRARGGAARRGEATRSGGRPACRVPSRLPAPRSSQVGLGDARSRRSSHARPRAAPRAPASVASESRMQNDRCGPAPDPPAKLVQLRQAEALGVLDEHHRCVRHVDPHLDRRSWPRAGPSRRPRSAAIVASRSRPSAGRGPPRSAAAAAAAPAAAASASADAALIVSPPRRAGTTTNAWRPAAASVGEERLDLRAARARSRISVRIGLRPGGSSRIVLIDRSP